jgi:RNA 2',3'-cyclic 3'-phosphodiesterase
VRVGLKPERRAYLPHITLARIGGRGAVVEPWLVTQAGLVSEAFEVAHFLLFESHLGREGARYEAIAQYALE